MKRLSLILLTVFFASLSFAPQSLAAVFKEIPRVRTSVDTVNGIPSLPYRAIMNQQNTQVYAECMAKVVMAIEKEKVLELPFPKHAENIQIFLPKHKGKDQGQVLSWIIEKGMPYKPQGSVEKTRITYESMHDALAGSLAILHAQRDALVDELKKKSNVLDPKFTGKLNPNLALIGTRISSAERELAFAKQRAEQYKDGIPQRQQLVVRINTPVAVGEEVFVAYTYTLPNSFWKPVYIIDANSKTNTVDVQLLAQVEQNSDLDWFKVQLELTTAQGNDRDPQPIYPWIVRQSQGEAMYAKSRMAPQAMMAGNMANDSMPSFSQDSAMARWTIDSFPKLVEGKTMIKLNQETWNTALQRIARPTSSANKVWLSAKQNINSSFYPAGEATFLLDGVVTGQGIFEPKNNEAQLFFGVDPLVTVETKDKQRKSAEKGLIDKDQTWTWTWNYSIENKRNTPVTVRIEEPQTQVEDAKMSITYNDVPKPEQGPEKTFIWTVDAKAESTSIIKRSITLKAPKDMKINLGR